VVVVDGEGAARQAGVAAGSGMESPFFLLVLLPVLAPRRC